MPIDIFITHQGVHKSIDREISGSNVAIPKSTLYQNISVPRWNNVVGIDIKTILSNLYYNDYKDDFHYNLGFFRDSAKTGNFKSLFELCPTGTRVWFVKNTLQDYRIVFNDWIDIMKARGQEKVLRKRFRKDQSYDDSDVCVEYEERTVELDDFADEYSASDWQPFDSNVYLGIGSAESNTLEARLFIKPEGFAYPKEEEKQEETVDNIDEDDDFVNEDDL